MAPAPVAPAPSLAGQRILVAGAHGGAGATTLAALLSRELGVPAGGDRIPAGMLACLDHPAVTQVLADPRRDDRHVRVYDVRAIPDTDPERIAAAGWVPVPPPGVPLILAARGTAEGARRAVVAVTALERRGVCPAAIAVVADGAGPEPRQAVQRFDLIAGRAGPLVRMPFAAVLRAGSDLASVRLPRRVRDAVAALAAVASHAAESGRSW